MTLLEYMYITYMLRPLLYMCCIHTQTDTQRGRMKQIQVQLTPFTTVDIPLTARELKQLRHTTPGGTFDVYPLSLHGKWVVLPLKGFKTVCVFVLFLQVLFKAC